VFTFAALLHDGRQRPRIQQSPDPQNPFDTFKEVYNPMPRNTSCGVIPRLRSPFARLERFSLLAALILLLLGVMPAASSDVQAQTGPDGKIAFVSDRDGQSDIYTMNSDGGNVQRLTTLGGCSEPVWSPDGNRIAFTHRRADGFDKIYRMNADGSGLSLLYIEEATPAHQRNPRWSPDGTRIAFSHEGPNFQNVFQQEIYVMDATTAYTLANYSFDQSFVITRKDTNPVWSPDGKKIAYLRDVRTPFPNSFQIIVLELATQTRVQITTGASCTAPVWSPDSTRLAFTRSVVGGRYARVTVINADGTHVVAPPADLTTFDAHPVWSPDGTKIAFETSQNNSLTGERLSGGIATASPGVLLGALIETVPGAGFAPSWSPNGSRITFAGSVPTLEQTEQSEIFNVEGSGNDLGRLTTVETSDYSPAWQPTQVDNTPVGANVTVNYGQIQLTFENVTATGVTSIQLIDANSLAASLPPGFTLYNSARPAFEIKTTATFTGAVTIGFTVPVALEETLATLKVLHGEGGVLVNRTAAQPAPTFNRLNSLGTIYARVTSLSPFVIVEGSSQDLTAPTITASTSTQPNAAGWYNSDATVMLRASDEDGGSGVASIAYVINGGGGGSDFTASSFTSQASLAGEKVVNNSEVDIPVTTEGTTVITYYATDSAGNSSPQQTIMLQLDKTSPDVTIAAPANGAVYTLNQVVAASYGCADGGSAIATCVGTKPSGSSLDTSSVGAKSFVVTAIDNAGNTTQQAVSYTVQAPVTCAMDVTELVQLNGDDLSYDKRTRRYNLTVTIKNKSATAIQGPISLVIDNLSDYGVTLSNWSGVTTCAAPLGSPYVNVNVGSDGVLKRNEKITVTLSSDPVNEDKNLKHSPDVQARVLAGSGTR
jgi:Tol biopolymer transport system component